VLSDLNPPANFVAQAPADMRDVFSQQAFTYDPHQRHLTVVLRETSPVLGEPGTYMLHL